MKTRFIINLRSGRAQAALPHVRAFASARGADLVFTARPRHGTDLAAQAVAEGCELVVAVGGDGTLNEVATALVATRATLGLVPCGSGDGLGRHLRIHGSIHHALEVLERGAPRLIDTGVADGNPFFTAAGIGFEAEIADRFNRLSHRGFMRYLSTSASAFRQWQPQKYQITSGPESYDCRAFTLAVANSDQYGNGARIAPRARVDDGRLNLTAVPPISFWSGFALLWRLFTGTIETGRHVLALAGPQFVVERDQPGLLHTDGEVRTAGRTITFAARPASLRIMVPARRYATSA